jgi:hypothetical protein
MLQSPLGIEGSSTQESPLLVGAQALSAAQA